jgi:tRNA pseudouridine55 synthase
MRTDPSDGVLVVDKPEGPTSHDVVDRVRRVLSVQRVGHTGTLDPFATGVLPILVGKATRLARFLAGGEKHYEARVRFGFATTTDDRTGPPLGPPRTFELDEGALFKACAGLTGQLLQVPPAYSAKRVDGRRLYALARAGVDVRPEAVSVTVHALRVLGVRGDEVDLEVRCSAGTYVRALARDLGERLGWGGHLSALRRTRSGDFGLEGALAWADLDLKGGALARLLPLSSVLPDLPAARVGTEGREALVHGRDLPRRLVLEGFPEDPPERMRILDISGELLGLAVPRGFGPEVQGLSREEVLHPEIVLARG